MATKVCNSRQRMGKNGQQRSGLQSSKRFKKFKTDDKMYRLTGGFSRKRKSIYLTKEEERMGNIAYKKMCEVLDK